MRHLRVILFLVIMTMAFTSIGVSAASPNASSFTNPDIVAVQPAYTIGNFRQNNGVCGYTYQRAKGWMDAYSGVGVDYIQIKQRFQWWTGSSWRTQKTWTTYRYTNGNYATLTNSRKFSFSGPTVTHTTRIQSEFSWWDGNYLVDVKRRSSGYCYP